jgi:hypothetical protein
MRYFVILFFSLLILATFTRGQEPKAKTVSAFKISWPVDVTKSFKLSSTFGESRMDHFHNGLDIPGKGINIYPVANGRIIWKTEAILKPGEIPFGGGKTIIMDHSGFWSGYMHLIRLNDNIKPEEIIDNTVSLGKSGDTGHSGGAHLHFFIYEPSGRKMINPLPYLDLSVYKNISPPKAMGYGVLIDNEFINIDPQKPFRLSKEFPLYAKIVDSGTGKEKWGVYSFESYTDIEMKTPVQKFIFNYIVLNDQRWKTSNGMVFEDVYYENLINIGSGFKRSKKLIWKSSGYMGPETSESLDLKIKD